MEKEEHLEKLNKIKEEKNNPKYLDDKPYINNLTYKE